MINYIPEHIRKSVGGTKDKTVSLFLRPTLLNKLCMGEERNQSNQENEKLKSVLYQKKAKKQ